MESYADILQGLFVNFKVTLINVSADDLQVVDYFIIATQIRIFVLKDIKTVRTCGNYFFYIIPLKNLYDLQCLHLVQHLVACPAGRIACTGLFLSQNGITDIQPVQDRGKGLCNFFVPVVKCAGTSYPEQVLRHFPAFRQFRKYRYFKSQVFCPVHPVFCGVLPWSPVILNIIKNTFKFSRS